nr:MAG TPA: hypothetical protein [Inoviridae sp.]
MQTEKSLSAFLYFFFKKVLTANFDYVILYTSNNTIA